MDFSTVGGSGSFHCFHQLQLPRIYSMEASMRFHIPLQTSTYFTEYHKLPAACTRLTGPYCCPPPSPSLQRPPWYSMVCSAYSSSLPVSPTHEQVDCSENHLGSTCPPPLLQWSTARLRSKNRGGGVPGSLGGSKRYSKESVIH